MVHFLLPTNREFKIRLRRDKELFTDDFVAENAEFDPAKVVAGDVEGTGYFILSFVTAAIRHLPDYTVLCSNKLSSRLIHCTCRLGHDKSLVHGFISDDGIFEGKIHVGNEEYFVESAKQYFKDVPRDFHSVMYESRDVHYPYAYGASCGINDRTKRWMDEVKK